MDTQLADLMMPAIDYSRIAVGVNVVHNSFGTGTITFIDQKRTKCTVKFDNGEKSFIIEAKNQNNSFARGFLKFAE